MKITKTAWLFLGIILVMGIYLAKLSKITSYMTDEPTACINCHVMNTAYDTWSHSAHREVTTCNSCHVPHENVIKKYIFKGLDGLRHSYVFTTRTEPQVLQISDRGAGVVQRNCINCHQGKILTHGNIVSQEQVDNRTQTKCWSCHKSTPHGKVRNLGTTYQSINPNKIKLNSLVPEWIKKEMRQEKENKKKK